MQDMMNEPQMDAQSMPVEPGMEQATPEEQAQLEQAVSLAYELLMGEGESGDRIAGIVRDAQDIAEGIARAAATALIAVEKKMGGLSDEVKLQAGQEIVALLVAIAVEYGALAEDEITEQLEDEVVSLAYTEYLTIKEQMGELDPNELQASVADAEQYMGFVKPGQQQAPAKKPGRGLMGV